MDLAFTEVNTSPNYQDFKKRVRDYLSLERILPDIPEEVKDRILDTICLTALAVKEVLGILTVDFGILDSVAVNFQSPGSSAAAPLEPLKIQASVQLKQTIDGGTVGIINYGLSFLRETAEKLQDFELQDLAEDLLRWTAAHEHYHIRQLIKFPNRTTRSYDRILQAKSKDQYLKNWYADWGEYGAELFAFNYIKNRKTKGFDQMLRKTLASLEGEKIIENFKQQRQASNAKDTASTH